MADSKFIEIKGAREHNLKNVDINIPKDKLTVITGLSGSGKSSLAFDTIYAEGQRRYVESLSSYARQFLDLMKKPDVDSIEGLSPAISIEQKTTSHNPRSTVGTVTEIYDYMRLLWARAGTPYSPVTGLPIESQTVSQMVDKILEMPEGTKLMLLAPIARGKKGEFKKEFESLQKQGFQRLKIDGTVYSIDEVPSLSKNQKHDIEVVIDRLVVKPDIAERAAQSVETALKLGDGLVFAENISDNSRTTFSSKFACPVSGFTIEEIEPRLFSFNNPYGACPHCDGIGAKLYMDPERIVPNPNLSIAQGAILPWFSRKHGFYSDTLNLGADPKVSNTAGGFGAVVSNVARQIIQIRTVIRQIIHPQDSGRRGFLKLAADNARHVNCIALAAVINHGQIFGSEMFLIKLQKILPLTF